MGNLDLLTTATASLSALTSLTLSLSSTSFLLFFHTSFTNAHNVGLGRLERTRDGRHWHPGRWHLHPRGRPLRPEWRERFGAGGAGHCHWPLRGGLSSVVLGGQKYMLLRSDSESLQARQGPTPVSVYKTATLLIVGVGQQGASAEVLSVGIAKVQEMLAAQNL